MDGLMDMIQLKDEGVLRDTVREIKERAILFLEEIKAEGGFFKAVEAGFFVDALAVRASMRWGKIRAKPISSRTSKPWESRWTTKRRKK